MADSKEKKANRLIHETSPYLLQHAYNPVDWYPWGQQALARSLAENRPILLSIGYAACHWCHVMEHESFEDEATAKLMNENFVCIKVDREERPDLDEIYMKAVQMMTGHGGWPMTVFLTSEGKPFYGGTYFPPQDRHGLPGFKRVLTGVVKAWQEQKDSLEKSSEQLTEYLRTFDQTESYDSKLSFSLINEALGRTMAVFDRQWGGLGGAPKFPHTASLELALRYLVAPDGNATIKEDCLEFITVTMDKMSYGGMHDQVGGGFARYAVDRQWLVPHFEKMLYDNATLSRIYLLSSLVTGRQYWQQVGRNCLDFVIRELGTGNGGFYSSLDADSEGEEGKFYVFRPAQILDILGAEDGQWVNEVYGLTDSGNFEHGTSVLHLSDSPEALSLKLSLSSSAFWSRLGQANQKILAHRAKRIPPSRDEKVLTSWNALMISSLITGYKVLAGKKYLQAALDCTNFICQQLMVDGRLLRTWGKGKAKLNGYLDDYAFFIQALLDLASSDSSQPWLPMAIKLNDTMLKHFSDVEGHGFFYTANDHEELVARPKNYFDGSIPSGTSVATMNLLRLWKLTGESRFRDQAETVLKLYAPHFDKMPDQFANLLCALDFYLSSGEEIVLATKAGSGENKELFHTLSRYYLPNSVVLVSETPGQQSQNNPLLLDRKPLDGKPTVYICRNYSCEKPITEMQELELALEQLSNNPPLKSKP